MERIIDLYALGLLNTFTALLIWFYSPLKVTIGQLFFDKDMYLNDQFDTLMLFKNKWLGKLVSCYICCSFWTSVAVGIIYCSIFNLSYLYPILTATTYPSLAYIFKGIINKVNSLEK